MSSKIISTIQRPIATIGEFLKTETASGFILIAASAAGLIWANSAAREVYERILKTYIGYTGGGLVLDLTVHHWIDDGLMAIFFLLVGLEIKRELLVGELSSARRAALPAIAAAGGMIVPALICLSFVWNDSSRVKGWAIPAATDIAFALAALRLAGARLPMSLKIFLTALAVIDDLGAIAIIAFFYTSNVALWALLAALGCLAALIALNRLKVHRIAPYLAIGVVMWYFVLQSGVHATVAGVLLALTIPVVGRDGRPSPLESLEHTLHPYVAFAIVPLFGFANAGVSFAGLHPAILLTPLPLGIALGLFVGKQAGIFAFSRIAIATGLAERPQGMKTGMLYGVSLLAGIGFTMSLFIGNLAFSAEALQTETKIGVFAGSFFSALCGFAVLALVSRGHSPEPEEA